MSDAWGSFLVLILRYINLLWRERKLDRKKRNLERRIAAYEAVEAEHETILAGKRKEIALYTLATIGGMALFWAKLEARLDHINELAFLNGAKDVIDGEIPQNLGRKLKFMRRSHNRLPWLADLKQEAAAIIQSFEMLSRERRQLIHGAVEGLQTDAELTFVRHIHGPGPLELDIQEFSSDRFVGIIIEMADLSKLVEQHHWAMNDALLQYRLSQIKR